MKYPEDFEELWSSFDQKYGKKGSKKLAYDYYKKLNPDIDLQTEMVMAVTDQIMEREWKNRAVIWIENLPHVFRWIRNERWADEIEYYDQQSTVERFTDRSWAK